MSKSKRKSKARAKSPNVQNHLSLKLLKLSLLLTTIAFFISIIAHQFIVDEADYLPADDPDLYPAFEPDADLVNQYVASHVVDCFKELVAPILLLLQPLILQQLFDAGVNIHAADLAQVPVGTNYMRGQFNPITGITIANDRFAQLPHAMEHTVFNELHHATVFAANRKKRSKLVDISQPFLNEHGILDKGRLDALEKIITQGRERLDSFHYLLVNQNEWSHQAKHKMANALKLFKHYHPETYRYQFSRKDFNNFQQSDDVVKKSNRKINFIKKGCQLPGSPHALGDTMHVVKQRNIPGGVELYYTFAPSKPTLEQRATAFVSDFNYHIQFLNNPELYGSDRVTSLSEMASNVDSMPAALKRYFFPEFCQYMSEYVEVNDYCLVPRI